MRKIISMLIALMILVTGCGGSDTDVSGGETGGETDAGQDHEYLITVGHTTTEIASTHLGAVKFKELVEERSDGKIKVEVYPNAQIGGDREIFEGVQRGEVGLFIGHPAPQVNFVKSATIFDLPFIYDSLEHARDTVEDPDFIKAMQEAYEVAGIKYFGCTGQGFRTLTSNDKVQSLDDMKGMTIRTMENEHHMDSWKLIGANPTPLPFNELYTALQQGVCDAQENPVELVHSQKLYEQQEYIMDTNHLLHTSTYVMNLDFFNDLPEELQELVTKAAEESITFTNEECDRRIEECENDIREFGSEFVQIPAEVLEQFREVSMPVYDDIKEDTDVATYEAYFEALEKHR